MELKIEISYEQVLDIVKQLPAVQVAQLVADAQALLEQEKKPKDRAAFRAFLLTAPRMSDEQYEIYVENRKLWNQWRA